MSNPKDSGQGAKVPVLIVGGGPVGLALACELGWRGIGCRLIERRDGTVNHPKMNQVGVRTMEFCRRWGIAGEVGGQAIATDFPRTFRYATSASGYELAVYEYPSRRDLTLVYSPEAMERCSQLWFDPILRNYAASRATVELSFNTRLDGFVQSASGVVAEISDLAGGSGGKISAQYLVACDGAESEIRETCAIALAGDHTLNFNVNVFFRSTDHDTLFANGPALMQWIFDGEGMWADIVSINGKELWRLSIMRLPPGSQIDEAAAADYIRKAVGKDFAFEIISILGWTRRRVVAERYREGRIFLAGDAAHQMSPTGGFGMNTGIQEAVDIGWKLAAMLDGWGGDKLLDSYDAERRPAASRITNEGARNYTQFQKLPAGAEIAAPTAAGEALRKRITDTIYAERFDREYDMMGATLGFRYEGSPIIVADGTDEPADDAMVYEPSARPGHRAPHVWLRGGGSILVSFGPGFTLLRLGESPVDADGLARAAAERDVPFETVDTDEAGVLAAYERRLVLVRPDGHVAWRGDECPADAGAIIDTVRGA